MASERMWWRLIGAAIPLVALAVPAIVLATNLGDAGGVSYREHSEFAPANTMADAVAKCPKRKSPTGGGYLTFNPQGPSSYQSAASKPFDGADADHAPDDGWEVEGQRPDSGVGASSKAICLRAKMRYVSRGHDAFGPSRVKVRCPRGLHVTGGGGSLGKPASSTLDASFPVDGPDTDSKPDDGWEVWGNVPAADQLRAFAACTKAKPAYHRAILTVHPAEGQRISAQCADGQHLLGVGGRVGSAPAPTARVKLAEPDDFDGDGVYDDAGAIFAINDPGSPGPEDGVVYAICTR